MKMTGALPALPHHRTLRRRAISWASRSLSLELLGATTPRTIRQGLQPSLLRFTAHRLVAEKATAPKTASSLNSSVSSVCTLFCTILSNTVRFCDGLHRSKQFKTNACAQTVYYMLIGAWPHVETHIILGQNLLKGIFKCKGWAKTRSVQFTVRKSVVPRS